MKATKIYFPHKIASIILWMAGFIFALVSCDVVEPDADLFNIAADITEDRIYVLANNSAFIDLNTKVQTNKPVRLQVTSTTRHGSLSDLGSGLLKYSPTVGNRKAKDSFQFTVYGQSNEVIRTDSVYITIENDATHLPCGIFTVNDYVYGVQINKSTRIDVLANDHVCGVDATSLVMNIHHPDNSFPPHHGKVSISGQSIIYTPDVTFQGRDSLIYKVFPPGHSERAVYGIAYINGAQHCNMAVHDDTFAFGIDSLKHPVRLAVLRNDSMCNASNARVTIAKAPSSGLVLIGAGEFIYSANNPLTISDSFTDEFTYEVCIDASCNTARVKIQVRKDSSTVCAFQAFADTIDLSLAATPLTSIDVLHNDSICGGYTTFIITELPVYGTASISNAKIAYQRDATMNKNDSLEYQICNAQRCSRAKVYIKRE